MPGSIRHQPFQNNSERSKPMEKESEVNQLDRGRVCVIED